MYSTPSPSPDSPHAIDPLPSASPEPLMIPPTGSSEDVGPSVSERVSPDQAEDVLMDTQPVGNNFEETIQLFREVDQELDAVLHLSPSVFNDAPQLGVRSAGPPEDTENPSNVVEERYMPRTPTPVELEVGEGPLPLEPADSTDEQSTDTQISSHALHPGYPWVQYTPALHGAPMTMLSMDDNFPFCADYVAYEVEPHHGDPTIYLTVGDGYPAYQHPLVAEPSNEPSMNIQPANLLLFHERFQTEPIVNRALEALGDQGVSTDVLRLRQFPGRRRALQEMKNQITRLEDFVLKECQRYYKRDQDLIDKEKEVRDRLIQARAVERMEPYLHFFDDHGHLQNLASRNSIIRGGWEDLLDGIIYGHNTPPPRLPMPEDDASSSPGPEVRFDLPEREHEVNHRRL